MNRLKELREERHWNMSEAAKHFKLPYTTYVSYEKGARTPGFDLVCEMAEFYDVSVTYLMGTDETRGNFPVHDEKDLISPGPDGGEAERDELIRILSVLDPSEREQLLAHGRTLVIAHEAQGTDPKSP